MESGGIHFIMENILSNRSKTNMRINKETLKVFAVQLFILHLKFIYFFLKLFPTKNQVAFISRQSASPSIDFEMLIEQLKLDQDKTSVVILCKQMKKSKLGAMLYYFHILKQSYVIARSRVCVIDTYIIPISVLKHKKSLRVIQIWHAIGKMKKSGYQTLDKQGGRDRQLSKALKMHRNYDYIIAGASYWNTYYCESFNVAEDKIKNFGLPRMDYLLKNNDQLERKIKNKYTRLNNGKKNVLYAPTFRRTRAADINGFLRYFNHEKFNLIVKIHPHDTHQEVIDDKRVLLIEDYTATQLLSLTDYLVTDYSSIAFEAALVDVKTFFYLHDYEKYVEENGLNLDVKKRVPSLVRVNAQSINDALNSEVYDGKTFEKFKKLVLPKKFGNATENIVDLIESNL